MKVAVLVLVLANLAVFVWLRSADGSYPEANLVPLTAAGKKLTLLPTTATMSAHSPASGRAPNPVTARARPATAISAALPSSAPSVGSESVAGPTPRLASACLVWSVASATVAADLIARLGAGGYSAHLSRTEVQVPGDFRIVLGGFADAAAARSAAAALRRGGMDDLYLLPAAGTHGPSLSLGVFSDRDHAERRVARVRALGFDPRISAGTEPRKRRHLEARVPAATSVSALLRAVGITHVPRRAACAPPSGSASADAPAATSAP